MTLAAMSAGGDRVSFQPGEKVWYYSQRQQKEFLAYYKGKGGNESELKIEFKSASGKRSPKDKTVDRSTVRHWENPQTEKAQQHIARRREGSSIRRTPSAAYPSQRQSPSDMASQKNAVDPTAKFPNGSVVRYRRKVSDGQYQWRTALVTNCAAGSGEGSTKYTISLFKEVAGTRRMQPVLMPGFVDQDDLKVDWAKGDKVLYKGTVKGGEKFEASLVDNDSKGTYTVKVFDWKHSLKAADTKVCRASQLEDFDETLVSKQLYLADARMPYLGSSSLTFNDSEGGACMAFGGGGSPTPAKGAVGRYAATGESLGVESKLQARSTPGSAAVGGGGGGRYGGITSDSFDDSTMDDSAMGGSVSVTPMLRTRGAHPAQMHVMRLVPGEDLLESIESWAKTARVQAGYIATCVGSTSRTMIRFAGEPNGVLLKQRVFEIVSLTGTVGATAGAHVHISVSDSAGRVTGGHLARGTIVRTTAELVLGVIQGITFSREMDSASGYKELCVRETKM